MSHPVDTIGRSSPLGAAVHKTGVNFSVFSRNASGMELLLFDSEDAPAANANRSNGSSANRTYHYWHVFVPGVRQGRFTAIAPRGRSILRAGCGLTLAKFCWTLMAAASWSHGIWPGRPLSIGRQRRHGDEKRGRGSARL